MAGTVMSSRAALIEDPFIAAVTDGVPCAGLSRSELLERCLGNVELAERILLRFRVGLEESLLQLQALVAAADLTGVSRRAHRLRGEAANVGAQRISEQASWLEQVAAEGSHEATRAAIAKVISASQEFRERIHSLADADE